MIWTIIAKITSIRSKKKIIEIISCDCFIKKKEIFVEKYIQVKKNYCFYHWLDSFQ